MLCSSGDESEADEKEEKIKQFDWEKLKVQFEIRELLLTDSKEEDVYKEFERASKRIHLVNVELPNVKLPNVKLLNVILPNVILPNVKLLNAKLLYAKLPNAKNYPMSNITQCRILQNVL